MHFQILYPTPLTSQTTKLRKLQCVPYSDNIKYNTKYPPEGELNKDDNSLYAKVDGEKAMKLYSSTKNYRQKLEPYNKN